MTAARPQYAVSGRQGFASRGQLPALLAAVAFVLAFALPSSRALAEPGGSYGSGQFRAGESHTVRILDAGPRKGWEEHTWTLRFGAFGARVTQRIDPATGFPPVKRTWGDSFFGVTGHKERPYFSANWSPWTFLCPQVTPTGQTKAVPTPTLYGRCEFAGIRERSEDRIVAEALFRDQAGGWTRVRFAGLLNCRDRFGVSMHYTPPPGETVESIVWQLVCQPHDYSDRGFWQRQRAVTTAANTVALPDKASQRFVPEDGPWLFHNRRAHLTSGTFLDRFLNNVATVTVRGAGSTVVVELVPEDHGRCVQVVCGDWVGEHWGLRGARLFSHGDAERVESNKAFFLPESGPTALVKLPSAAAPKGASEVRSARERYATACRLVPADSAPVLLELAVAKAELERALAAYRAEWVTAKRWPKPDR